jgi:hypothetical protein
VGRKSPGLFIVIDRPPVPAAPPTLTPFCWSTGILPPAVRFNRSTLFHYSVVCGPQRDLMQQVCTDIPLGSGSDSFSGSLAERTLLVRLREVVVIRSDPGSTGSIKQVFQSLFISSTRSLYLSEISCFELNHGDIIVTSTTRNSNLWDVGVGGVIDGLRAFVFIAEGGARSASSLIKNHAVVGAFYNRLEAFCSGCLDFSPIEHRVGSSIWLPVKVSENERRLRATRRWNFIMGSHRRSRSPISLFHRDMLMKFILEFLC